MNFGQINPVKVAIPKKLHMFEGGKFEKWPHLPLERTPVYSLVAVPYLVAMNTVRVKSSIPVPEADFENLGLRESFRCLPFEIPHPIFGIVPLEGNRSTPGDVQIWVVAEWLFVLSLYTSGCQNS